MSGNRWEDYFGDRLRAKGYDDITIMYDPGYGWLVNYGAGEFEAPSTAIVTRRIEALPWASSVAGSSADRKENREEQR